MDKSKIVARVIKKLALASWPSERDLKSAFHEFSSHPEIKKGKITKLPWKLLNQEDSNYSKTLKIIKDHHSTLTDQEIGHAIIKKKMKSPIVIIKKGKWHYVLDGNHRLNEFMYMVKENPTLFNPRRERYDIKVYDKRMDFPVDYTKLSIPIYILNLKDIKDKEFLKYLNKRISGKIWD